MTSGSFRGWAGAWALALAACTSAAPAAVPASPQPPAPAATAAAPAAAVPAAAVPAAAVPTASAPTESTPSLSDLVESDLFDGDLFASSSPAGLPVEPKGEPLFPGHAKLRIGQEELRARFDPFPRALTPIVSMGEQQVAHQIPMTLAYFETRADLVEVLEFYAQQFARRGWSWTGIEENSKVIRHPAISATDPEDGSQMSVIVMSNGKGEPNTVILGLADVRPEARVPDEGELPRYPGSSPITVRSSELGGHSFTQTFVTQDAVREVVAFYEGRMRELGWDRRPDGAEPGEATVQLAFAKAGRLWRIRVSPQKEATMVLAVSSAQEEDRP